MSKFQLVLLGVFGVFIVGAVLTFALYRGGSSAQATVTIWGTFSTQDMGLIMNNTSLSQDKTLSIDYVEKSPSTLEADFTEALAQGNGPDLVILRQDQFWNNKAKLMAIPYSSISQKNFTDTFVEAGEVYLTQEGVYGLPLAVDPMVLYYNRDLLSAAGIAKPLSFWDEIFVSTGNLSKRDAAGNLTKSTIALGETKNIANSKDILSLLMLQAGTPITGFVGTELQSFLGESFSLPVAPADSALEFYTQFSNPTKAYYSWNRVLPEAQTRFTAGDMAYYLGYASELRALRNKNPTLNFSVASVPQSRVSGKTITIGRLYAVSISRGAKNPQAAFSAAWKLSSAEVAGAFSQITLWPPARRDLLSQVPNTDSILPVFYSSALQSKSWVDPNTTGSAKVFSDMVDAVTSGRAGTSESVGKADRELETLIKN